MKGYLETKHIPLTESFLASQGWKIDRWDGVISLINEDFSVDYEGGITIGYRKVITSLFLRDKGIGFYFSTTKDSTFLKDKHLKTKTPEEWFELMEEMTTILVKELGLTEVAVYSGRKDKAYLLSKGYRLEKNYFYHKTL